MVQVGDHGPLSVVVEAVEGGLGDSVVLVYTGGQVGDQGALSVVAGVVVKIGAVG